MVVAHGLGSSPNLSTTVIGICFFIDIIARAMVSKGIGNVIDILKFKEIKKGMWSIMKNVFLTVIALCVAYREVM